MGVNNTTITLVDVEDLSTLVQGDDVLGYPDDARYNTRKYYVTDVTDDEIALQDTETSFGYIRDKDSIILEFIESE